jgi:transcriptional regulator with XRE-family HTH domain
VDRTELASFLRSRRARVRPDDVGLVAGWRRQTPGLRRAELAELAGLSVDYVVRLEQARGPQPSRQVLTALARALRLSVDERSYLLRLAGQAPPANPSRDVPASVLRLLDRLPEVPAKVLDAKFDLLAWNPMLTALIGDPAAVPEPRRNTLRWLFQHTPSPLDSPGGRRYGRQCVADLRAAGRYPHDPGVRALVEELTSVSEEFAGMWRSHDIEVQRSATKRMVHPVVGELELDCEILHIPEHDQRLMFYTAAPGTTSHHRLRRLQTTSAP